MDSQQSLLTEREAVRDMGYRFADACNIRDEDAFRKLWIPEGVWKIGPPKQYIANGREEIVGTFNYLLSLWEYFVQLPHAPIVTIDGDQAESRWTVTEHARNFDRTIGYFNHGYYIDRMVRTSDGWKYQERSYTYLFLDETAGTGEAFPRPELGGRDSTA